jgi:hypothetical protein
VLYRKGRPCEDIGGGSMVYKELVDAWNRERRERLAFHDLMRYRVREILLVGSLYDSFIVESDGFLTEQIYGEYFGLNLSSIPRVTSAYTDESALGKLASGSCDLVIIMASLDFDRPLRLAGEIRRLSSSIPILLLVLNNSSLSELDFSRPDIAPIDRIFVWNGYSKLLVGMIKYVEDRGNVDADTATGLVRVILIIEDSVRYYSRYLPLLYSVVLEQIQAIIEKEKGVETYKLLRSRSRPKLLLASTYEEAETLFVRYEESMLAVITDLRFQRRGEIDPDAGFAFVTMARTRKADLPVLIQSSAEGVRVRAESIGVAFADKSSESLALELRTFLRGSLGFGDFVFVGEGGEVLCTAGTIEEFMARVGEVPVSCLIRHASKNQFSIWLKARGEYRFAGLLKSYGLDDFITPEELRAFLLRVLDLVRREKSEGLVPEFDEGIFREDSSLSRVGSGSVGGKGRAIEFIKAVIETKEFSRTLSGLDVRIPRTLLIGIDAFEEFLERNELWNLAYYRNDVDLLLRRFRAASMNGQLIAKLKRFIEACPRPLAVRSSGLLENMVMLPFAGIYEMIPLPNNDPDSNRRLADLVDSIRLVWASQFSIRARSLFEFAGYQLEEERMAILIQELVGHVGDRRFGPLVSGIAFSSGAFPGLRDSVDGPVIAIAGGLCQGLTDGCPSLIGPLEDSSLITRASREGSRLLLNIDRGRCESSLSQVTPDRAPAAGVIGVGVTPRAATLIARALGQLLELGTKAYGNPVSLEFSAESGDEGKPELFLLQVRPIFSQTSAVSRREDPMPESPLVAGRIYGNLPSEPLVDIICIDTSNKAHETGRKALIAEIGEIDRLIAAEGRRYILVGSGRFGDFHGEGGIPIGFSDILHAALVIELREVGQGLVPAVGSHFFTNLSCAGVAFLICDPGMSGCGVNWERLRSLPVESARGACMWSRAQAPLAMWQAGKAVALSIAHSE